MENRVSSYEERQLTNAIERAATVCSVNDSLDRNKTLVQQLKKASVDPKFAKTAAQAFNKRLTVLTFKKTADEHKADPFELSDPDVVYNMMSGEGVAKAASAAFSMSTEDLAVGCMEKAASVKPVAGKNYEHSVSMEIFQQHLDSIMDKYAACFRALASDIENRENAVEKDAEAVADYFKKASYDFDFTTAVNLHGDKLKEAIGDKVDKGVSFKKTASFVLKPKKEIFDKVAKLIEDRETLRDIKWLAGEIVEGLSEFAKSASAFSEEYQIKQADLASQIAATTNERNALQNQLQGLRDKWDADARSGALANRAGGLADVIVGTGAGLVRGGFDTVKDLSGAFNTLMDNAKAKYYAGNNVSISPGDLLDASFLTKDRYRDRLLAWSDMSADPQLAMYPAEQVFAATQKAMDMDTSMERPDQREVLRAQVAQLLAQNNRMSTADIAALATTLKSLQETRQNASMEAAKGVDALPAKEAPAPVESKPVLSQFISTEGLKGLQDAAMKDLEERSKALDAIDDRNRKMQEDEIKGVSSGISDAKKRLQQLEGTEENRLYNEQQKQLADANAEQKRIDILDEQRQYQETKDKEKADAKAKADEAAENKRKQDKANEEAKRKQEQAASDDAARLKRIIDEVRRNTGMTQGYVDPADGKLYYYKFVEDPNTGNVIRRRVPADDLKAHAQKLFDTGYDTVNNGGKRKGGKK